MSDETIGTRVTSWFARVWLVALILFATAGLLLGCLPRWLGAWCNAARGRSRPGAVGAMVCADDELRLPGHDLLRQIVEAGQPLVGTGHAPRERR